MSSNALYVSVLHDDNAVAVLHGAYALRDDEFCGVGDLLPEGLAVLSIRGGIDRRCGIIKYQYLRFLKKRPGDTQTLFLSA